MAVRWRTPRGCKGRRRDVPDAGTRRTSGENRSEDSTLRASPERLSDLSPPGSALEPTAVGKQAPCWPVELPLRRPAPASCSRVPTSSEVSRRSARASGACARAVAGSSLRSATSALGASHGGHGCAIGRAAFRVSVASKGVQTVRHRSRRRGATLQPLRSTSCRASSPLAPGARGISGGGNR